MLKNLYKRPKRETKEEMPHFQNFVPNHTNQADLLFMPNDRGFRYALVLIDIASRKIDAVALKSKSADEVGKAFGTIYTRKPRPILEVPKVIEVDAGGEFKKLKELIWAKRNKVRVVVKVTARHRAQGLVERVNATLQRRLMDRQHDIEILTGETNREWKNNLAEVVAEINKTSKKPAMKPISDKPIGKGELLKVGTMVRVPLEEPIDNITGKRLFGRFRITDLRWHIKPRRIMHVSLKAGYPPLYLVNKEKDPDKVQLTGYTKQQLFVIPQNEAYPDASVVLKGRKPTTYVIDKIINHEWKPEMIKRKKVTRLKLLIRWAGFTSKDDTWEDAEGLKDIDVVQDYIKHKVLKK